MVGHGGKANYFDASKGFDTVFSNNDYLFVAKGGKWQNDKPIVSENIVSKNVSHNFEGNVDTDVTWFIKYLTYDFENQESSVDRLGMYFGAVGGSAHNGGDGGHGSIYECEHDKYLCKQISCATDGGFPAGGGGGNGNVEKYVNTNMNDIGGNGGDGFVRITF